MEELDQLERHDRQRRQDAVAKIPVSFTKNKINDILIPVHGYTVILCWPI